MESPSSLTPNEHALSANDLSILFADLLPRSTAEVENFLASAAFAIGGREADLARQMNVSPATLSSWKSRGKIPDNAQGWFASREFLNLVVFRHRPRSFSSDHWGIGVALRLFRSTDFQPFGASNHDQIVDCVRHFGGICALALFVAHCMPKTGHEAKWQADVLERTGSLLQHLADVIR